MKIADNCVVFMNYTLTDDEGKTIDTNVGGEPMPYLHGCNNIVPGLEKELNGLEKGAAVNVSVQPEDGYGPVIPEAIATFDKEAFGDIEAIEPGMQFQAEGPEGQIQIITVKEITEEGILVDGNHPLAGQVLNFEVEIMDVREATAEELEHGHPHLEDGESCDHEPAAE